MWACNIQWFQNNVIFFFNLLFIARQEQRAIGESKNGSTEVPLIYSYWRRSKYPPLSAQMRSTMQKTEAETGHPCGEL
jgi:hypothetical protein